jgi:hypothetical protein
MGGYGDYASGSTPRRFSPIAQLHRIPAQMDPLAFLLKLIGTTARIGAIIALTALALCVLVQGQIQPFATLAGTTLYQTIIVAGMIGLCTVIVEIFIAVGREINERIKTKMLFIEQPGSWSYVEKDGVLQLHAVLHVTNQKSEDAIVTRAQLCLPRFPRKRAWQDCFQLQVGDDLSVPGMIGARLPARTVSVVIVRHIHRVAQPRSRSLIFLFEFCDQWRRRHRTRLHLQPRQSR